MFKYTKTDLIFLLPTLAIIIVGSFIYAHLTKNKAKLRTLPLKIFAIYLVLLEISKQTYYIVNHNYDLYYLPLHFCSLFMPMFILSELTPKKVAKNFKPMAFCFSLVVTLFVYLYPNALIGRSTESMLWHWPSFVSFSYHMVVVAYFVYSLVIVNYVPRKRDCLLLIICILTYISYAVPAAYLLNENYVNILQSYVPQLEQLRLVHGQFVYNAVYLSLIMVAICIVQLIYYAIYKLVENIKFRVQNGKHKL